VKREAEKEKFGWPGKIGSENDVKRRLCLRPRPTTAESIPLCDKQEGELGRPRSWCSTGRGREGCAEPVQKKRGGQPKIHLDKREKTANLRAVGRGKGAQAEELRPLGTGR